MSTNDQIRHLQALQDTEANKRGQIDREIANLQANLQDEAARNAGYLAMRGANVQPPK